MRGEGRGASDRNERTSRPSGQLSGARGQTEAALRSLSPRSRGLPNLGERGWMFVRDKTRGSGVKGMSVLSARSQPLQQSHQQPREPLPKQIPPFSPSSIDHLPSTIYHLPVTAKCLFKLSRYYLPYSCLPSTVATSPSWTTTIRQACVDDAEPEKAPSGGSFPLTFQLKPFRLWCPRQWVWWGHSRSGIPPPDGARLG